MYSPQYAVETDRSKIDSVIRENPFATIIYTDNSRPESFHLPLIIQGDKLIGHMAKANPAWKKIAAKTILVIFHGPQGYISPEFYGTQNNVGTWNYISIHVRGKVTISQEEKELKDALLLLSRSQDPNFDIESNIADHSELLKGIVALKISIDEVFAKFKLA